jgi:putative endonuclease
MAGAERARGSPSRADAGARAEGIAAKFLEARGLTIVDRNFRTRLGEIDLIARDGAVLVFVEVRLRRNQYFGGAGASITAAKCARLTAAARAYLGRLGAEPPCRFDAVLLDSLDPARIEWERDILSG